MANSPVSQGLSLPRTEFNHAPPGVYSVQVRTKHRSLPHVSDLANAILFHPSHCGPPHAVHVPRRTRWQEDLRRPLRLLSRGQGTGRGGRTRGTSLGQEIGRRPRALHSQVHARGQGGHRRQRGRPCSSPLHLRRVLQPRRPGPEPSPPDRTPPPDQQPVPAVSGRSHRVLQAATDHQGRTRPAGPLFQRREDE